MSKEDSHFLFWVCVGALTVVCMLCSCRSHVTGAPGAPARPCVEETLRDSVLMRALDSVYVARVHLDTVYDSVATLVRATGDTVYVERDRWHYAERWRADTVVRLRRDTVRLTRVDTVRETVQLPGVEVEKRLTRWQEAKMKYGGWCALALVGVVILVIRRVI